MAPGLVGVGRGIDGIEAQFDQLIEKFLVVGPAPEHTGVEHVIDDSKGSGLEERPALQVHLRETERPGFSWFGQDIALHQIGHAPIRDGLIHRPLDRGR